MIPARRNSNDAREFLASSRALIDSQLDLLIPKESDEPQRVHAAIRWSVFAGGKRFRPALLLATGQTFGASIEDFLRTRSEEHTSELQSQSNLVCRLLLEIKN